VHKSEIRRADLGRAQIPEGGSLRGRDVGFLSTVVAALIH
jgi:hypothetical protein